MFPNHSGNKLPKMFKQRIWLEKKGISIIEILIAVAIILIALTSLLGLAAFSLGTSTLIRQNIKANNIAQESMEQVRNFRDGTNWDVDGLGMLTPGLDYYFQKSGSPEKWQPIQEIETVNGFTRKVVFGNVSRDAADDIEETYNSANDDPNTKKITVIVFWSEKGRDHQIELVTYLTNWRQ